MELLELILSVKIEPPPKHFPELLIHYMTHIYTHKRDINVGPKPVSNMVHKPLAPTLHITSKLQINYNNAPDTLQLKEKEVQNQFLKPYTMFRYSVRSEVTRKYYETAKFLSYHPMTDVSHNK
jgi:hypothetical protein